MKNSAPAHPNLLREYRLGRRPTGWTQERLVVELERVAGQLGIVVASRASLKVQVSRWENGHFPVSEEYRRVFRRIFRATDSELGFSDPPAGEIVRSGPPSISFNNSWDSAFETALSDWTLDVDRRDFLKGAAYVTGAATTPALQWFIGDAEVVARPAGQVTVGMPHVEGIREMTATFRRLDDRYGGGHSRQGILRYLVHDVAPLVREGHYDARTGSALLSATAEMLKQAGWMTYDAGEHRLGQHYMTQALRLARAAGDEVLGGEILAALSHQASYVQDGPAAVALAQAAKKVARTHGLDALTAEASVMEAHGHAVLGDGEACGAALSQAEAALDRADRSADPQWIGYFDEAYLSAKFGHCFKELREPATAVTFAVRSLDMNDSYVRGRVFNLALLATAHAQAGELEEASRVGIEAALLAAPMQSARADHYLAAVAAEMARFGSSPALRRFEDTAAVILARAS